MSLNTRMPVFVIGAGIAQVAAQAGHAVKLYDAREGAVRALQVHADAEAYAGIALGPQVLLASVFMPLERQVTRTTGRDG